MRKRIHFKSRINKIIFWVCLNRLNSTFKILTYVHKQGFYEFLDQSKFDRRRFPSQVIQSVQYNIGQYNIGNIRRHVQRILSNSKAHIPNIHALNSDTHTLRIQYEYTQKQCVGVAIEGMDILYMKIIKLA